MTARRSSPTSKKIDSMTHKQIQRAMVKLLGEDKPWAHSWDAAHEAADRFALLKHPRYYAQTRFGKWAVKEAHSPALAVADTGPLAICKAILTLSWGKGEDYSTKV